MDNIDKGTLQAVSRTVTGQKYITKNKTRIKYENNQRTSRRGNRRILATSTTGWINTSYLSTWEMNKNHSMKNIKQSKI